MNNTTGTPAVETAQAPGSARSGTREADCIVAIKPCCNRIVFATVTDPLRLDAAAREEIGELAADGCRIEHWTAHDVRAGSWGCKCAVEPNTPAQHSSQ